MALPEVLYEDNHLLVLHKPAGWLVQGDKTGDATLTDWAADYIKKAYDKPGKVFVHPTHRIDRPVSGLVVFARTSKALERMNALFREDKIVKYYLALTHQSPTQLTGTLRHWLIKNEAINTVKAFTSQREGAKEALLHYETLAVSKQGALLLVKPVTGRPHQIRVQLAEMGCIIAGDLRYGAKTALTDQSIALHAWKIQFVHPVQKQSLSLTCRPESPVWASYKNQIDALG